MRARHSRRRIRTAEMLMARDHQAVPVTSSGAIALVK
jgi:hypothetical protein